MSKSVSGLTCWVGNCSRVFKISFCSDQNCGTGWWVAGCSKCDITSACGKSVVNVGSLQHIVHQQCKAVDIVCSEQVFIQRECVGQRHRSVSNGHCQQFTVEANSAYGHSKCDSTVRHSTTKAGSCQGNSVAYLIVDAGSSDGHHAFECTWLSHLITLIYHCEFSTSACA